MTLTAHKPSLCWMPGVEVKEAHSCSTPPELCKAHRPSVNMVLHFSASFNNLPATLLGVLQCKALRYLSGKWPDGNLIAKDADFPKASHHPCPGTPPSHVGLPRDRAISSYKGMLAAAVFQTLFLPLTTPFQTLAMMSPSQLKGWLREKPTAIKLGALSKKNCKPRSPIWDNVASGEDRGFDGSIWESRIPWSGFV